MQNTKATRTLLIADAEDASRGYLTEEMRKRGFEVRSCDSVQESLVAIKSNAPAFTIIDLRLGEENGLNVLKALSTSSPATRSIVLTRFGDIRTAVAAIKLGACDYLLKPSLPEEIINALVSPQPRLMNTNSPGSVEGSQFGNTEDPLDDAA